MFDKVEKVNDEIASKLRNQAELDQFQRPVKAFLTLETEDGFDAAMKYNKAIKMKGFEKYREFLGHKDMRV